VDKVEFETHLTQLEAILVQIPKECSFRQLEELEQHIEIGDLVLSEAWKSRGFTENVRSVSSHIWETKGESS